MDASQMIAIRNRIIGVLIERARIRSGSSIEMCAELLGCSPAKFRRYEGGQDGVSLPQLESLARFFNVPIAQLWNDEIVQDQDTALEPITRTQTMSGRHQILAVRLQQCRRASGLSRQDVGLLVGQPADVIAQYERAELQIPIAELEIVAGQCGLSLSDFEEPPITAPEAGPDALSLEGLKALPPDLWEFILDPGNVVYLRVAQTLGSIEPERLRQIAQAILETQG